MHPRTHLSSVQSKRFSVKRRNRRVVWLGISIGGLVVCLLFGVLISSASYFQITDIKIQGTDVDTAQKLTATALESIQGTYFGMIPRSNVLFYPQRDIESRLEAYPEARDVSFDTVDTHTLAITIAEKKPAAIVCATLPEFSDSRVVEIPDEACYFVDTAGFIFKRAPSFSGLVYERFYFPELGIATSTGDSIGLVATSTREFQDIYQVYERVTSAGISVEAILAKANNEYELYAHNPASEEIVVIYFNTIASVEEQIANLITFWNHEIQEGRARGRTPSFESIDVRYGSNVFYR